MTGSGPRVVAVMTDLLLLSRIDAAVAAAGGTLRRLDGPESVPPADLVLVDWSARTSGWGPALAELRRQTGAPRILLFGRHTDLEAHAEARAAGVGPMWARSKLVAELPQLVKDESAPPIPPR